MKKLFFLLPLLFLIMFPRQQYADMSSASAATSPTPVAVDYQLPYPGLLPDNPLYGLKVLRDRLVGFFISDPLKKSSFDLLQADKRLQAGVYLSQETKIDEGLIVSTVSKGENYFSESIDQLDLASKQGQVVGPQIDTLLTAAQKHILVLEGLEQKLSSASKTALQQEIDRIKGFEKMVAAINKK